MIFGSLCTPCSGHFIHLQTLCGSVQDTEEQIAKELAERRLLLQQLEECCG